MKIVEACEQQRRQHRETDHQPGEQAVQPGEGDDRNQGEQGAVQNRGARPVESPASVLQITFPGITRQGKQADGEHRQTDRHAGVEDRLPPDRLGQKPAAERRRKLPSAYRR